MSGADNQDNPGVPGVGQDNQVSQRDQDNPGTPRMQPGQPRVLGGGGTWPAETAQLANSSPEIAGCLHTQSQHKGFQSQLPTHKSQVTSHKSQVTSRKPHVACPKGVSSPPGSCRHHVRLLGAGPVLTMETKAFASTCEPGRLCHALGRSGPSPQPSLSVRVHHPQRPNCLPPLPSMPLVPPPPQPGEKKKKKKKKYQNQIPLTNAGPQPLNPKPWPHAGVSTVSASGVPVGLVLDTVGPPAHLQVPGRAHLRPGPRGLCRGPRLLRLPLLRWLLPALARGGLLSSPPL